MLKDKTILITGAASGLGKAWSKKFSDEGAIVFACDINEEGLTELKGHAIHTQVKDVSKPEHVQDFIKSAHTKTGRVDVLFNNAGMGFGYKVDSFLMVHLNITCRCIYLGRSMECDMHFL